MMLLFYAGMASDRVTEQIGLAHSVDGVRFTRVGQDGLLIRRDPLIGWKDTRVCNPCIFQDDTRFRMLYQGVGGGGNFYSIGHAVSDSGYQWMLDDDPCLDWSTIRGSSLPAGAEKIGPIEPHVLKDSGTFKVWFNFRSPEVPQNLFYYAETDDFKTWDIHATPILDGRHFFGSSIWYPQVIRHQGAYHLYFMVRGNEHAIYECWSKDGTTFGPPKNVLGTCIDLSSLSKLGFGSRVNKRLLSPLLRKVLAAKRQLYLRWGGDPVPMGIGHPHWMEIGIKKLMYVHRYHANRRGHLSIDIALYEQFSDRWQFSNTVLSPSVNPEQWDAFFVADPYVLCA